MGHAMGLAVRRGRWGGTAGNRLSRATLCLCALLLTLAACSERMTAERALPHPDARIQPIFVATERKLDKTGPFFGFQRPEGMNYFRADISVPPTHQVGVIEWPDGPPDAASDFVVTGTHVYDGPGQMIGDIRRAGPGRETLVFIHGYNNTLSESMYRLAQIQTDFATNMPAMLFSWPSAGDPRGYIYDRDSVMFARDDLVALLDRLTARPGDKVFLIAHSMGSHLAMEALRQAKLSGKTRLLSRVSGVTLMSPDIDPDLFDRQAEVIGKLPQPFLIFISKQDRALSLAGFITGRKPRLGVIDEAEKITRSDVTVIDFTELADGNNLNHFVPVTSPAAISVLNGIISQAGREGTGFLRDMALKLPTARAVQP
ncbi:Esterase/lipase superfamily enzyme [Roseovarius lutimaris]|uniref:Esterase/lipase superfamily enzyme n=1 Tax=Roseovarius lutimaris TaxID=1005928 RepID=A0A1I5AAY0_9RHOB|nr:alpha/beta fold hydrolase [Roseovarius lutimaris]SFN59617.1 Esterase/lipase superfamily enzyme [Roseovarius lutimaris]